MANAAVVRRIVFVLASLVSIFTLLAHLEAWIPMRLSGGGLLVPSLLMLGALGLWAREHDPELALRARAGVIGGLWGTVGYDAVRVPLHLLGQNPFAPIRAYGMWLLGAPQSSALSDLVGVLYHFSNGVTFGLIWAVIAMRAPWAWAIAWGLALEAIAVASAFGEVFAIRQAYGALGLAFAAHVFYGAPLGWTCRRAARGERIRIRHAIVLALAFAVWFLGAWQPPGRSAPVAARAVRAGPDALEPGWSDAPAGATFTLVSAVDAPLTLRVRHSSAPRDTGRPVPLPARGIARVQLDAPGVYQIGAPGQPWRSVFVAVRRGDDYRPR